VGSDRQDVHERIRRASVEAARARDGGAERNDMLDRLAADPTFVLDTNIVHELLDPRRYIGRAPEQVDEFLAEVVDPALAEEGEVPRTEREEVRV
jgi:adenylosuccinate lyase